MSDVTATDSLTSFIVDTANVRGRVVRLGAVATTILSQYDYPPAVAKVLGELLVVAAMLGSNLKQEGIFTLQIRGNGPIPLLVVDAAFGGQLRGFAEVPAEQTASLTALGEHATPRQLFGDDAYFAITLDPGAGMQRYQGVVALEGENVADTLEHYFTHSQQLDVLFVLAVGRHPQWAGWQAGGFMIERLPAEGAALDDQEGWRYASAIAQTLKAEELLDPLLEPPHLLYRLYHEEGVRVHTPQALSTGCRCSRTRIHDLLMSMDAADRADMIVDGVASVHCQFCNSTQRFTPDDLGIAANQ